jgi:hypothetical protein
LFHSTRIGRSEISIAITAVGFDFFAKKSLCSSPISCRTWPVSVLAGKTQSGFAALIALEPQKGDVSDAW